MMVKQLLQKREKPRRPERSFWVLLGILAFSFFLNFWNIGQNGTGNEYYAACVKSMTQSWHNFFFVSFDPAGMVSVDKPPLGLWMQAISCKIFGYSGWAMLLPQAVAGTLSCLLIYLLTQKYFGKPAGLAAAFLFALTPAVVLVSRNSTMDMQLIFWLLLAVWFLMKSIDTGKWRWLMLCGALIGVGFNVKMLQAYLIVPAVVVTYLIFAKGKVWKRFAAGALAAVLMLGISFAWIAAVDLTPASQRPYVDSTSNNSALELVFGHNGVERLTGESGNFGGGKGSGKMPGNLPTQQSGQTQSGTNAAAAGTKQAAANAKATSSGTSSGTSSQSASASGSKQNTDGRGGQNMPGGGEMSKSGFGGTPGGGGMGGNSIGTASPLRLWNDSLYGQACWLLLFAIAACVLGLRRKQIREKDPAQRSLVFWGMWLLIAGGFFSFAGFFHAYYLCMLAPPIAVLSGIGLVQLYRFFQTFRKAEHPLLPAADAAAESAEAVPQQPEVAKRTRLSLDALRPWLLGAALLANILISFVYVLGYSSVSSWLAPLILVPCAAGLALLTAYLRSAKQVLLKVSAVFLAVSLLAGSAYWAWTPVQSAPNATIPTAGPTSTRQNGMGGQMPTGQMPNFNQQGGTSSGTSSGSTNNGNGQMPNFNQQGGAGGGETKDTGLETYLKAHYKKGSFLLTACNSSSVAQLIIDTGLPCYAYGGFLGSDNSLTVSRLKELVAEGKITYFLVSEQGGPNSSSSDLITYVEQHATKVDSSAYSSSGNSDNSGSSFGGRTGGTLYLFSN
ncbi:ArnT family glycosyltransferase [Caproicibacterium sp. XB1]|uniref:ArnT family glycosyltransferase n=1 Tax=Caproicibacterium sp. XB1 TaxID=3396405 RepID=UPI0039B6F81C